MLKSQALPTEYISGTEVGNHRINLIVDKVVMKKMNDGMMKPVMYFVGKERGMVVNSGNWDAMELVYGVNSDDWAGRPLVLFTAPTQTPAGQPTLGCRIRATINDAALQAPLDAAPVQSGNNQPMGPGDQAAVDARRTVGQPMVTDSTDLDDEINF